IISVLLVLLCCAVGVTLRFYPRLLPLLDTKAKVEIYDEERQALRKKIKEKYTNLSPAVETKLLQQLFQENLKLSGSEINAKIKTRAAAFKNIYRDADGHVYLVGIDSYYWLRLLRNLLEKGHIGDRVVQGVDVDDLQGAPIDNATRRNVHLWLGVLFYKIASLVQPQVPLEPVLFYIPIFLSCVIAVFSFFVAKKLGANDLGAFFAAMAINLSPFFMVRSVGEWFDTDIYNVFFPLLVFGTSLYAFDAKTLRKRLGLCGLAALFLAFYASTWKGWWFIFDLMVASGGLFILNLHQSCAASADERRMIREQAINLGLLAVLGSLFVLVFNGVSVWKDFIAEPLRLSAVLKVTSLAMWPNVYWTVAELGPAEPADIIRSLGGYFIFFSGLFGLLYLGLWERGLRDARRGFGLLCLIFWISGVFYASMSVLRFILLLVVPVGLSFGLVISKCTAVLVQATQRTLKKTHALAVRCAVMFILVLYLTFNIFMVHASLLTAIPSMNDTWNAVLTRIKQKTSSDAVIVSWWDFGHWLKAVANRRVLFDGMTQNTPHAYWIAYGLLTDNEKEAAGILRMINGYGNKAVALLEGEGVSVASAVGMIKKAVVMSPAAARIYFAQTLKSKIADELCGVLFPAKLPPVYFIVSSDMPVKIGAISYIGNWDFSRVEQWLTFRKKQINRVDFTTYATKRYNLTLEEADQKFLELSLLNNRQARGWYSRTWQFVSGLAPGRQDEKVLFFENGLVVNLANNHAYVVASPRGERGVPESLFVFNNNTLTEVPQKDPSLSYSALMIKENDDYKSVLLDTALAKSMLVRLYYFKGDGLKYFKLFDQEKDDKGNAVYVYKMEWPSDTK
ncbi:MAG: STT3 domain-containing protein, partial [Candidatus Omnitrophota bacterium]